MFILNHKYGLFIFSSNLYAFPIVLFFFIFISSLTPTSPSSLFCRGTSATVSTGTNIRDQTKSFYLTARDTLSKHQTKKTKSVTTSRCKNTYTDISGILKAAQHSYRLTYSKKHHRHTGGIINTTKNTP